MKHKHKHSQMLIASVAFLSISGCTTPVYEGQYAWSQGWRVGKVTKLITADAFLEAGGSHCQQMELVSSDRIAVIQWRQVTRTRGHFAKIDQASGIAVGDEVYFNAFDCDQPQMVPKFHSGRVP